MCRCGRCVAGPAASAWSNPFDADGFTVDGNAFGDGLPDLAGNIVATDGGSTTSVDQGDGPGGGPGDPGMEHEGGVVIGSDGNQVTGGFSGGDGGGGGGGGGPGIGGGGNLGLGGVGI